jgi:hypothetical protein
MIRRLRSTPQRASRRSLSTITGLLVLLGALILAPSALAGKPKGEFAVFNDCPLSTAGVNWCVYSKTTSGELVFGTMKVPIVNPIVLQGGLKVTEKEETFVNTTEGETLSKTAEEVPGGFEKMTLTATLELVGAVALSRKDLSAGEGTAIKLPVRAHLKNAFLGESCFIGSSATPITLNLTTGTTSPPAPNKPIKGSKGTFESKEEGTLEVFKSDSLVENAFSVPAVKGCGGIEESIIDPLLNSKYGLPSSAGHNTVIMNGTSEFATAEAVKASE